MELGRFTGLAVDSQVHSSPGQISCPEQKAQPALQVLLTWLNSQTRTSPAQPYHPVTSGT